MKTTNSFPKTAALIFFAQLLACVPAGAGVPLKVNFQGKLSVSGQPADGTETFGFKLYDAPNNGNLVWTSQDQSVTVSQGVFSVILETGTTVNLSTSVFSGPRYAEITVNGQPLSPRQEMVSAPYALVAQSLAPDARVNASSLFGGLSLPVKTITQSSSPYTATGNDNTIIIDASAGDTYVNLPDASAVPGRIYIFKRIDSSASFIAYIKPSGTQTIDGVDYSAGSGMALSDLTLGTGIPTTYQNVSIGLQSDGSNWIEIFLFYS